jgi:uncharacterized protein (DUF433 family)
MFRGTQLCVATTQLFLRRMSTTIPSGDTSPALVEGYTQIVRHMDFIGGRPALKVSPRLPVGLVYARMKSGETREELVEDLVIRADGNTLDVIFKEVKEYGDAHPECHDD